MEASAIHQVMEQIELFSDGSCWKGNGGWGTILRQPSLSLEKELSGWETNTTNNRMELIAVIKGLELLVEPCLVSITSDSQYVVAPFQQGWIMNWVRNGWHNTEGPLKNKDLWERIWDLSHLHRLSFFWVHGHKGHPENTRCDKLALHARKYLEALG